MFVTLGAQDYRIPLEFIYEPDWESHVAKKLWATHEINAGLYDAITFARCIYRRGG